MNSAQARGGIQNFAVVLCSTPARWPRRARIKMVLLWCSIKPCRNGSVTQCTGTVLFCIDGCSVFVISPICLALLQQSPSESILSSRLARRACSRAFYDSGGTVLSCPLLSYDLCLAGGADEEEEEELIWNLGRRMRRKGKRRRSLQTRLR